VRGVDRIKRREISSGGGGAKLRSAQLRLNLLLIFLVTPRVLVSKFTFNVHSLRMYRATTTAPPYS